MKLPNAEAAFVPPEKLTGYLLSETHPVGRSKATFFRAHGFDDTNVDQLDRGLKDIASTLDCTNTTDTGFGIKFVVDGTLQTPRGTSILIRTVWIIDHGTIAPRFVTAYPL